MKRESVFLMVFLIILATSLSSTLEVHRVEAIGTVYIRADGSIDPPNAPISTVDNVTYTLTGNITSDADGIVVERDGIMVDGSGFMVEGTGVYDWHGICLDGRSNVTIKATNVTNYGYGIYFDSSSGNRISGNNMTNNGLGIVLNSSSNNVLSSNNITNNLSGIALGYSSNNTLSGNNVTANTNFGIALAMSSSNNTLSDNNVSANSYYGIWLSYSCDNNNLSGNNIANNSVGIGFDFSSDSNTLSGSNVTANSHYGIYLRSSSNNFISHNNFVNNTNQVITEFSANIWDHGYPSGGNYWSDYNGTDLFSGRDQNETGRDAMGDTEYLGEYMEGNNTDNYPLMGMFYSIDISFLPGSTVTLISNSTISYFDVETITLVGTLEKIPTILINFTDQDGYGFCRVSIPHALMNITNTPVTIDYGFTTVLNANYVLFDNGTQRWIYFAYEQSAPPLNQTDDCQFRIMIIPEFPTFLILPLFFVATLSAVIIYRRRTEIGDVMRDE